MMMTRRRKRNGHCLWRLLKYLGVLKWLIPTVKRLVHAELRVEHCHGPLPCRRSRLCLVLDQESCLDSCSVPLCLMVACGNHLPISLARDPTSIPTIQRPVIVWAPCWDKSHNSPDQLDNINVDVQWRSECWHGVLIWKKTSEARVKMCFSVQKNEKEKKQKRNERQATFKKRERMSRVFEVSNDQLLGKVAAQRHNFFTPFLDICWLFIANKWKHTWHISEVKRGNKMRVLSRILYHCQKGSETFCKKFSELRRWSWWQFQ